MSHRFHCWSCKAAFLSDADASGRAVVCPKCGVRQSPAPSNKAAPPPVRASDESVFVPADGYRPRRRKRLAAMIGSALVLAALASVVAGWPVLKQWWKPVPRDPIEIVASSYLQALIDGNAEAATKIGTVELPPAIRSYRDVKRDRQRDEHRKGSFAPITAMHAKIEKDYVYDSASGRYTPRNLLGPAAETLDALHDAKAKAEQEKLNEKIRSGNPDDLFDAAESMSKPLAALADGVLSPRKLVPSYLQLVEDAKPPLPAIEKAMALDFAADRQTWDALLKRPFVTLKSDGPFLLDRADVTALATDALGSLGDPPTPLRLTLTRFRLEGIDTGWKVTSVRRQLTAPARETKPAAPEPAQEKKYAP